MERVVTPWRAAGVPGLEVRVIPLVLSTWLAVSGAAHGAPAGARVTLSGGLAAAAGADTAGAVGAGFVRYNLPRTALSLEAGSREGVALGRDRVLGAVIVGGRWAHPAGPALRLQLVHHHETPLVELARDPLGTLAGSGSGITHRSGLGASLGYDRLLPIADRRWHGFVDLSVAAFPDHHGAPLQGFLELGLAVDLGRLDGAAERAVRRERLDEAAEADSPEAASAAAERAVRGETLSRAPGPDTSP